MQIVKEHVREWSQVMRIICYEQEHVTVMIQTENFLLMEYQTEATRWMDIPLEITRAIQKKYPEDNKGSDGPLPKTSLSHFL